MALLTIPVILYQLFFVLIQYVASRFGPRIGIAAMLLCLLWTAMHLFFWPLMLLQAAVILGSWWWFRHQSSAARH